MYELAEGSKLTSHQASALRKRSNLQSQILVTCRGFHQEASQLLYQHNTLQIDYFAEVDVFYDTYIVGDQELRTAFARYPKPQAI